MTPLAWLFFTPAARADLDQMIKANQPIKTEEREVSINGARYREIKYGTETAYVKFRERAEEFKPDDCWKPVENYHPNLIEAQAKIYHRTSVYIQALRTTCTEHNGQTKTEIEPHVGQIGITFPDSPKDTIKNKRLFIMPLKLDQLNFSGEW